MLHMKTGLPLIHTSLHQHTRSYILQRLAGIPRDGATGNVQKARVLGLQPCNHAAGSSSRFNVDSTWRLRFFTCPVIQARVPGAASLQNTTSYHILFIAVLSFIGVMAHASQYMSSSVTDSNRDQPSAVSNTMAPQNTPEGRPGNLTADQEEKLRKLWASVFQLCGVTEKQETTNAQLPQDASPVTEAETPKKKRFGLFRKNRGDSKSGNSSPAIGETQVKTAEEDDKYDQTKQYHETLANHSPETIRETIWAMVKHDHPDALALRFLRARKWDVEKALVMLVSTMNWRHSEMKLDDDIMKDGEAGALEKEKNGEAEEKRLGHDFLSQIRMGKSFLHGTDKTGRPVCIVRVRLHKQGEQCEESLERYTVYLIETTRMVLSPPVDTAVSILGMFVKKPLLTADNRRSFLT